MAATFYAIVHPHDKRFVIDCVVCPVNRSANKVITSPPLHARRINPVTVPHGSCVKYNGKISVVH
jgi:hypothetical protein